LEIDVIEFNDFILPNEALNNKELDANSMQHQPYLDNQCQARGYNLVSVGKTVLMPFGVYSKKIKSLNDLPEGAKVAIPNDPTNGGRALLLLKDLGLISLKRHDLQSVLDITENPKKLSFVELEAPQLPRSLDDVDIALINTDWVVVSGLDSKSALAVEGKDSPYANILVVRKGDESRPDIQKLVEIYHSDDVKKFINDTFKGAVLPAW
jgi:D-methionine transport system substrate-binding protein